MITYINLFENKEIIINSLQSKNNINNTLKKIPLFAGISLGTLALSDLYRKNKDSIPFLSSN